MHLARHAELAEAAQQPALLIHREGVRAMRAALEGDYERGGRVAASCSSAESARRRRAGS